MKKLTLLRLVGLAVTMQHYLTQGQDITSCIYKSSCSCETNLGTIDLDQDGSGSKQYTSINPLTQDLYYWQPCTDFTINSVTAGAIQTVSSFMSFDLGVHELATTDTANGFAIFKLATTTSLRISYIKCICGSGDNFAFVIEDPTLTYNFEFTSKTCCPIKPPPTSSPHSVSISLSVGSILVIIFFSLVVAYILFGTVFQVTVRKAHGREMISHITVFLQLLHFVKDGFVFVFTFWKRGSYSKM